MIKRIGFLMIMFMIVFSCTKKDNRDKVVSSEEKATKQMHFNIDSTEIGDCTIDPNIMLEYCPPIDWGKASKEFQDNMNSQITQGLIDTTIKYQITDVYYADNGSVFSVAKIDFAKDTVDTFEKYKTMVSEKFKNQKSRVDTFTKDDIKITQFLISNKKMVNFKLLFYNPEKKLIQLDYIVPLGAYEFEIHSIESSIGSVKINKNKPQKEA